MTTSRTTATIKVVLYPQTDGRVAIGIVGSQHVGPRRIDLRISPARPTSHRLDDAPPGVPVPLWLAYVGLKDEIDRCEAEAAERRR